MLRFAFALAALLLTETHLLAGFQCACSRIQSVGGGFGARDQLLPGSWLFGLGFNYQPYRDLYDGLKIANTGRRSTDQQVLDLNLEYSPGEHWTLGAQIPYIWVRNEMAAARVVNATDGIGDLRLLARASLGPKGGHGLVPQVLPLFSLRLPTGHFDPALGNANVGTGLGLTSLGAGASAVWALVGGTGEAWLGGLVEQPLGQNAAGFEFGTAVLVQAGALFGVYHGSGLSLEASYESYGKDRFQGADLAFRQGQFVYLTPGLQLSLNRGWSLNASLGWLANAWTGGDQLVAPWRSRISSALAF